MLKTRPMKSGEPRPAKAAASSAASLRTPVVLPGTLYAPGRSPPLPVGQVDFLRNAVKVGRYGLQ